MTGISKRKQNTWAYPDEACTSCRNRKIKCGREKPRCSSCYRDGHECLYLLPPKRVNHIKVLCQSFDEIQSRLDTIQGDLARLSEEIRRSKVTERVDRFPDGGQTSLAVPIPGHIVRDRDRQIERYHGPWSLIAQYHKFESDLVAHSDITDSAINILLQQVPHDCIKSQDLTSDLNTVHIAPSEVRISLPPIQLLSILVESFLKDPDPTSDILHPESVYHAMDRVYKDPSSPHSDTWALCFNLIVLLSLSKDRPLDCDDPFIRPMLQAVHSATRNWKLLTEPRLINIQVLALFTALADQGYTDDEDLGSSVRIQACVLAREAGLQYAFSGETASPCLSASEKEEWRKLYQSLYIRDRYSMTAVGSLIALDDVLAVMGDISDYPAHWELVRIHDKVHKALCSNGLSHYDNRGILVSLRKELEAWQQKYSWPSYKQPTDACNIVLHLQFVGIRMHLAMADKSSAIGGILDDARCSCLLLILSCSQHQDQAIDDCMQEVLGRMGIAQHADERFRMSFPPLSSPSSPLTPYPENTASEHRKTAGNLIPLDRLIQNFPITAIFVVARNSLGISGSRSEQRTPKETSDSERDTQLLERLLSCFQNTTCFARHNGHPGTHACRLGRVLEHLVQVIRIMGQHTQRNSLAIHHSTESRMSPCTNLLDSSAPTEVPDTWCSENPVPPSQTVPSFHPAWSREQEILDYPFTPLAPSLSSSSTDVTSLIPSTPLDVAGLWGPSEWASADLW